MNVLLIATDTRFLSGVDIEQRLDAWAETPRMDSAALRRDTFQQTPVEVASAIRHRALLD